MVAAACGLIAIAMTCAAEPRVQTLGQFFLKFSCLALLLAGVRRHRPAEPMLWYAVAAYFALSGIRNIGRVVHAFTDGWNPFSADVWEILLNVTSGVPLAFASIHLLRRRGRFQRWTLSDAWVLGVAVALAAFILAVLPLMHRHGVGVTFWNSVVITVVRDVLVLIPVIAIWYSESLRQPALKAWCNGIGLMMIADLVYLIGGAHEAAFSADPLVFICIGVGQLLLAGSASFPSMRLIMAPTESPRPSWHLPRTVVMAAAALLPIAAVLSGHPIRTEDIPAVLVGFGTLVTVMIWRMRRAVVDANESINESTRVAHHDALTGLGNSRYLHSVLSTRYEHRVRSGHDLAVVCCYLDVDELKHVNDRFQHASGDELLLSLARSLQRLPAAEIMRVGGDEFIVVAELSGTVTDRSEQAERLALTVDALGNPTDDPADGTLHRVSIGASWAVLRQGSIPVAQQLQNVIHEADLAQVEAKKAGGHQIVFFRPALSERARRRRVIAGSVKSAWPQGEMSLAFQPVVAVDDGAVYGVESLLRWQHSSLGSVSPEEAIEIAAHSGRMIDLGIEILDSALAHARDLPTGQRIGVNLNAQQLRPQAIDRLISSILRSGSTEKLWLEVTEQMLVEERSYVAGALEDLRSVGVVIAIDDFGTGYCGLDYLCTIPVDIVKLDKVFAREIATSSTRRRVARLGVQLSESIGAATLAEGVEDHETATIMGDLGCRYLQGYALRRPGFDLAAATAPVALHQPPAIPAPLSSSATIWATSRPTGLSLPAQG